MTDAPIRVLVVDDSAYNRKSIGEILGQSPQVHVVGKAADGEEALNRAMERRVLVQGTMSPRLIIVGGICA